MTNELILSSDCLLSKFGFNDGDMPDALMDWLDDNHPDIDYGVWVWHPVLIRLVRERLLPALKELPEVYEIVTHHNPIRAVDGSALEYVEVRVPFEDVFAIMLEVS